MTFCDDHESLGAPISMNPPTPSSAPSAKPSPRSVKTLSPAGAIEPTGTWSLGTRAGDFIFVAGMRGIDPATNTLAAGDEVRIT